MLMNYSDEKWFQDAQTLNNHVLGTIIFCSIIKRTYGIFFIILKHQLILFQP